MLALQAFAANAPPGDSSRIAEALLLFLLVAVGLLVLLGGVALLARARRVRQQLLQEPTKRNAATTSLVDPWREAARRLDRSVMTDGDER